MKNYILSIIIIISLISLIECGLNIETLKYCCNLGTNHANSGLKCENYQLPTNGVKKEDERYCFHSMDVCCRKNIQEMECNLGKEDAKSGRNCAEKMNFRKDCCEACQLGTQTGLARETCQDTLGLGQPYEEVFVSCCKNAFLISSTPSTTTITERVFTSLINGRTTELINNITPLPPIEDLCDIGDICAQICIPTNGSYRCDCNKGYTLMSDGISCKLDKRASKKSDRCEINNPCDHICTDTGVAVKCSCREGYQLGKDKKTCKDIDECVLGIHDCAQNEECVNEEGTYFCDDPNFQFQDENSEDFNKKCPEGYKFNGKNLVCDDIDECEIGIVCDRPKICINTIGSFKCEGEDKPQCPPGFYYKPAIDTCADIDECVTGQNDCNKESQTCLNTKGNYTCVDKVSKKNCPPGFKKNLYTQNCDDINECEENDQLCGPNEECINEPGGHTCLLKLNINKQKSSTLAKQVFTSTQSTTTRKPTAPPTKKIITCPPGYKYYPQINNCVDIDECREKEQICDSNQDCFNTLGSYSCNCKMGFTKDFATGACVDINECQVGTHDCTVAQRCDNTIGSYLCARITGCGTGYTLNSANGLCEDDDECVLGSHTCNKLGFNLKCRNTMGSFRCDPLRQSTQIYPRIYPTSSIKPIFTSSIPTQSTITYPIMSGQLKKCLPGYRMNERGGCEDINECESNPCERGFKCLNFNGRYQCLPPIQCTIGYELDESRSKCVDINECTRGIHKCHPTQICKNGQGYYNCECPPGHHLNRVTNHCEDIDECSKHYRACPVNADCINTVGSYKCRCKEGFKELGSYCEDIDECEQTSRLCEHSCVNTWGSYRCACRSGFTLNYDNRTCTDVDECEEFKDKRLCIGTCKNIPGSYACTCPRGYDLGSDGRTCRDIDECAKNICSRPDDICLNTRGGHKCYTITCPPNYFRDPEHKGRCKRPQTLCDARNVQCILMPEQYTYHYMAFISNMSTTEGNIQFFQIRGPQWAIARAEFSMKIVNVNCPYGIERVNDSYFKMIKSQFNTMQLYLVKPIQGPQEIELKIEMQLFQGNVMTGKGVSHIFILVSEYSF